jgi:hypothetical protein
VLEKIPGIPLINKEQVIYIYEADWSLIQKYCVSYKLDKTAAREKTVPIEQAGVQPVRSAIELAASRVIAYETSRPQKLQGAVLYNEAKACYDRVIENLSNLTQLREGLPIQIAQLHAQTFHTTKYRIKHRMGIGSKTHSHLQPSPVYEVGQGSTNAPARWGFICDHLINLYKEHASDAFIYAPISDYLQITRLSDSLMTLP